MGAAEAGGVMAAGSSWRDLPPTRAQLRVLVKIGRERGRRVGPVTRGEAADLIAARLEANPVARRASVRAAERRARDSWGSR